MAKAKSLTFLDPQASTDQMARRAVYTRLDELYNWSAGVDAPYEVRGLHNLRIAAKRLRYTLEIFEDTLPPACHAFAGELAQVQDELGAMHDNDVLIALLRLCLGSEDAGLAYEQALVKAGKQKSKEKPLLPSDMVAAVLDPDAAPDAKERYGLEQLLLKQSQSREEHYQIFRRHWHQLQVRDFRRELLDVLQE